MRHQSPQARQEEENKARDQNTTESVRRTEYRCALGRGEGQSEQNTVFDIRVRQQYGLPESVPEVCGLRCAVLHLRAPQGS